MNDQLQPLTSSDSLPRFGRRRTLLLLAIACAIAAGLPTASSVAGDLGFVPFFDGERADSLNLWGGPFNSGNIVGFVKQSAVVRSGVGAYQANLGSIPNDGFRFFQTFSSAVNG